MAESQIFLCSMWTQELQRICLGAGYLSRMAGDTLPSLPGPTDTGGTLLSSASTWEGPSRLI